MLFYSILFLFYPSLLLKDQTQHKQYSWPANIYMISKKRFTIPFSQDCSNGWSMGHTRLEFLPLLLCPCSQKSFFQGWWWCLQLSTGSWASPNISLDDYSNLEMCTFGRSSSFVCLFFVLFLSYHKASFHYFSRFQILALQRVFGGVW